MQVYAAGRDACVFYVLKTCSWVTKVNTTRRKPEHVPAYICSGIRHVGCTQTYNCSEIQHVGCTQTRACRCLPSPFPGLSCVNQCLSVGGRLMCGMGGTSSRACGRGQCTRKACRSNQECCGGVHGIFWLHMCQVGEPTNTRISSMLDGVKCCY